MADDGLVGWLGALLSVFWGWVAAADVGGSGGPEAVPWTCLGKKRMEQHL